MDNSPYIKNHIPKSSKRPGTKIEPLYLTIHSTGNPSSTAANERGWLTNSSNTSSTSWHICVDEKEAVEAVPLDEIAHHAGTTKGNRESIGIEICESGDRAKTIANAVELVAQMLHERNWTVDNLKRHYDWSGKICPAIFCAENWKLWHEFRERSKSRLDGLLKMPSDGSKLRFNAFDELPEEYVPTIQKMLNMGVILNPEKLNLSEDMLSVLVLMERYVEKLINVRSDTYDDLPDWSMPTIQKILNRGVFADTNNLDLSIDMLRIFVILDRLGLFEKIR